MKFAGSLSALFLVLCALPLQAADLGLVTIADGGIRVLRGVTWYKLAAGARVLDGDIVEVPDKAQMQAELSGEARLDVAGPATLYVLPVPSNTKANPATKAVSAPVLDLLRGWLKVATKGGAGVRVRTPIASLSVAEAIAVVHADPGLIETFVETGAIKLAEIDTGSRELASHDLQSGEYWSRSTNRAATTDRRPPAAFVAAMPRTFRDALPSLAGKFKGKTVELVSERDVNYAEARPWLTGPYRKDFYKRLQPRLADAAFRSGVESHMGDHMEWDRLLHPEKYLPKDATTDPSHMTSKDHAPAK